MSDTVATKFLSASVALDKTVTAETEGLSQPIDKFKVSRICITEGKISITAIPGSLTKVINGGNVDDFRGESGVDSTGFSSEQLTAIADFVKVMEGFAKDKIEA